MNGPGDTVIEDSKVPKRNPEELPDHDKYCMKADEAVRKDPGLWRWGRRDDMIGKVDEFCGSEFKKDRSFGLGPAQGDKYDFGRDSFWFAMYYDGQDAPSKQQCSLAFREAIDGCATDAVYNQFNLKWWARIIEKESKIKYEVIPTERRVYDVTTKHECHTYGTREQQKFKGRNGLDLPDEIVDKMMRLGCVNELRRKGFTNGFDCGSTDKGAYARVYMHKAVSVFGPIVKVCTDCSL